MGSVMAVYVLYTVVLREYALRLLWPALVLVWALMAAGLMLTVGRGLLPANPPFFEFVLRYPDLCFVLLLGVAALCGWLCRPCRHLFAEKL